MAIWFVGSQSEALYSNYLMVHYSNLSIDNYMRDKLVYM